MKVLFFLLEQVLSTTNLYSQQEAKERQFNNEAKSTHLTTYSQNCVISLHMETCKMTHININLKSNTLGKYHILKPNISCFLHSI